MTEGFPRRFGPYVLLKPLARGGMGALYLAIHGERGLEKLGVLKTVLPHLVGKGYVQRFRDEAKIVVRLSHGNLVTVFDAGQVEGEIFLAMDFVEGRDLRAVWNRCAQKGIAFPVDIAVHIVKELARGLGYAHSFEGLRLVHRDVSPPNVLVSYTGEVKLTDFGLASSTLKLEKTAPGIIYGKVSYMAPEQARGETLDGRADLYAAGIILWELLTGRQLFPANKVAAAPGGDDEILERVRNPEVHSPSQRAVRVPPDLDRIVMKVLAPDPARRYQSGEELRADLAAFQAKTAPATDGDHVARFLRELFSDQMAKEREERKDLLVAAERLLSSITDPVNVKVGAAMPSPARTPVLGAGSTRASSEFPADKDAASRLVGTTLGGRYLVRRLVGEGGMGRVYEAEHLEIGKRVGLKILHPAYSRTPEVVERFRREARAASKVGHPHIVNVTDSGTTADGSFFFVMEFVEGVELGLVIYKEGPMQTTRMLVITEQVCQALQAAHDAGVIHRDLKPENILLVGKKGETDYVKVLDFGIAKSSDVEEPQTSGRRLTRPGVAMGTPEYMAPEQAAGKPADPRSDIYAVGSIMYEMLTGTPPYDGDNVMEVLHKKANESPRPLSELRPEIPPVIEALIERAMAREPAQRPQTMAILAADIRRLLEAMGAQAFSDETVTALKGRRESPVLTGALDVPSVSTPWGKWRPAWAGAAGLLAAVAAVVMLRSGSAHKAAPAVLIEPRVLAVAAPVAPPQPKTAPPAPAETAPQIEVPAPVRPRPLPRMADRAARKQQLNDGQKLLTAQRYEEARASFGKLTKGTTRAEAFLGLGQVAFQQQNYEEAARHAQHSVAAGAGNEARLLLGDASFKQKNYAAAKIAYGDVLKRDPQNQRARSGLQAAQRFSP